MSADLTTFTKPGDLKRYLETAKSAIAMALPKHLNADRMLRLAVTCFSTTPALRNCDGNSILASIVVASQIGLEPGVVGQGYLIPYGKTCTFVPGWQGLVGLLNNSGRATAWTGAVFEGDVFDFQLGSRPSLVHVPGENFGDPDKMTWVYACGKVNGSEQPVIEAWPIKRVWRHRDKFNKVGTRHYSFQHPEMYARKVVLLQVLKYMPRSIELNNALVAAEAAETGRTSRVEDGIVVEVGDTQNDSPAGSIGNGNAPVDDAANTSASQAPSQSSQTQPATDSPSSAAAGDAGEKKAPEPEAPAGSLKAMQKDITNRLSTLNVGKTRLVQVLVDEGQIERVVPFAEVPHAIINAVLLDWENFKGKLAPAE